MVRFFFSFLSASTSHVLEALNFYPLAKLENGVEDSGAFLSLFTLHLGKQ